MEVSLEYQLFEWKQWDEMDIGDAIFYDVTLKVPVGEFKAGQKFHSVYWKGSDSTITFYDDNHTEYMFELKVSVGEKNSSGSI